jgi:Uma2 family endonuclease
MDHGRGASADAGRRLSLRVGEGRVEEDTTGWRRARLHSGEVFAELRNHVKAGNLGRTYAAETGFVISRNPDTVLAPDAAFVNRERVEVVGQTGGYFPGAPDLAVEVLSPNDTHTEVTEKALAWLDAGSRLVLVADPQRRAVTVADRPRGYR